MKKFLFLLFFIIFSAHAQVVKEIKFNHTELLPLIPIQKGDKLTPSLVRQTIVDLYKTDLFYNVEVKSIEQNGGVTVVIDTIPAKYFGKIMAKGRIGIRKRRLKKLFREFYPRNKMYRRESLKTFIKTLKYKFGELGYPYAKIEFKTEQVGDRVNVYINVDCGKPLIVKSIKTENKKLYKKFFKTRENHIYNKELFLHDLKKLRRYLRNHHYLNSEVSFKEQIEDNQVSLKVKIKKGKKFSIKSKNLKIDKDEFANTCVFFKTGKIDDSTIKLTEKNLYFDALKLGYCDPKINIEVNKDYLYCEIKNPKKKKIDKVNIQCDIPLKLDKKFKFFNKLTKSDIFAALSTELSLKGYLKPKIKFDYDNESRILTVKVDKGVLFKVGRVNLTSDVKLPKNFLRAVISEGQTFNNEVISNAVLYLKSYLIDLGYFDPQVNIKLGKPVKGVIPVNIFVNAGKKVVFEGTVILGNLKIKKEHILKFADFKKGDTVCKGDLEDFKNKLEFSGLFRKVDLNLIDKGNSKAVLLVNVQENRLYSFSYALGINSDEGLRFTAKIRKRYLFDTFLTGMTIFRVSSKRTQGYFTVSGEKHFLSSVYFTIEDKDDYKFSRFGFSLSYRYNLFSKLKFVESLEFTKNNLTNLRVPQDEIEKELQPDYTVGLRTNILYDRRNDILFPSKGYFVSANLFPAYVLTDDEFFFKARLKAGLYFDKFEFITTIGKIFTKNGYRVPIPQRFFAGGSTTLRISSFEKAGPEFSTGVSKGGQFLFIFSGEYKYHIKDIYYFTVFADVGNVWEDSSDFSFSSCIKDAGIGLMVKTPVGPMKIQLAHNLDKGTFPSNYKLVFSFGTTF